MLPLQRGGALYSESTQSLQIFGSCVWDNQVLMGTRLLYLSKSSSNTHAALSLCHSITLSLCHSQAKGGALSVDVTDTSLIFERSAVANVGGNHLQVPAHITPYNLIALSALLFA